MKQHTVSLSTGIPKVTTNGPEVRTALRQRFGRVSSCLEQVPYPKVIEVVTDDFIIVVEIDMGFDLLHSPDLVRACSRTYQKHTLVDLVIIEKGVHTPPLRSATEAKVALPSLDPLITGTHGAPLYNVVARRHDNWCTTTEDCPFKIVDVLFVRQVTWVVLVRVGSEVG